MRCGKTAFIKTSVLWAGMLFAGLSFAYDNPAEGFLKATPDQMDMGSVPEGKKIEVTSVIQNVGSAPIEITSVKTS
jgi:hypothetical protein